MHSFRNALPTDARRCFEIESSAYEGDEAATLEKISKRIKVYPDGFLLLESEGGVAGFINCGCAYDVEMSDEDFKDLVGHDPDGPNVVILSVVVDPAHQGKGYSRALMVEFIDRMKAMGKAKIFLICKEHHVPMYERYGYRYLQPSLSDHGGMAWHDMFMEL
jgi:ribosomal protein S18 acetylase RimI-like enzyme